VKKLILSIVAFALLGCSHWTTSLHSCNPLGDPDGDCMLPFPSSFYTKPDPDSRTGVRVDLTNAALPTSSFGVPLDPTPYNRRDGFSSVASLLAYFPEKIDPSNLPGPNDTRLSMDRKSPIQLFRYDTGERVPLFAELDANADPSHGNKQGLIIQPVVRLHPGTRYVAIIQGLKTPDGKEVAPLVGFKKLRDERLGNGPGDIHESSLLAGEVGKFTQIFQLLDREGIPRHSLQLAWDFSTGSDEQVTNRLVQMRDEAEAKLPENMAKDRSPASSSSSIQIDQVTEEPKDYPNLMRQIQGKFSVASFLEDGNGDRLHLDAHGDPAIAGSAQFPLTIHVPECAKTATGPLPVVIYGHGTFNSAKNEMTTPYSREILNRLCMIEVGTDWLGRAKSDLPYFLLKVLPNWNNFVQITDRLQQAHVNVAALAKMIHDGALDALPSLQLNGKSLVDRSKLYYYGISEGGCQGVTALALSPDIQRGALNVPCGFWTMFFWRSSDFHQARWALRMFYPGELERQKLMVLSQLLWDYTDPANYGGHLLHDPLPGNQAKKILYQEGINDASVPNLTTRAMARTIGLKLLKPNIEDVEGIDKATGPLDSGYAQFDVGVRPRLGLDNVPPAKSLVHEEIRQLEAAQEQLKRFLKEGGTVQDTCNGRPCSFPM
jgi:hypothetical protein